MGNMVGKPVKEQAGQAFDILLLKNLSFAHFL